MQAVLITAFHKFEQLSSLVKLLSCRFEVYIHIDKKAVNTIDLSSEHVHVYSIYEVNWGGYNHLKAILHLMKEALNNSEISYFHLISGEDWPVLNLCDIYQYYENSNEIVMLCTKFSKMTPEWYKKCKDWQQYYHWLDRFNYKKLPSKVLVKSLVEFQRLFRFNRYKELPNILGEDKELAQGLVWGSYPRDAIEFCFNYSKSNPKFLEWLSKGQAAEEYYFQTILANSPEFEKRITNNHFRYMNWTHKNGSYPGILDIDDYSDIQSGKYFFCRKVDLTISKGLIEALNIKVDK